MFEGIMSLLRAGPQAARAARNLFFVNEKGLPQLSSKVLDDMVNELSEDAFNLALVRLEPATIKSILRNKIFPGAKNDKELYDRIRNQYGEDMSFGFTLGEAKGNMLDEIVEIYDNLSLSDNRSGVMTGKKIGSGEVN